MWFNTLLIAGPENQLMIFETTLTIKEVKMDSKLKRPLISRRENALQSNTPIKNQIRLHIRMRLISSGSSDGDHCAAHLRIRCGIRINLRSSARCRNISGRQHRIAVFAVSINAGRMIVSRHLS